MLYWGDTKRFLARLWYDQCGITSVEYALLLAFIGGGIIVVAAELGVAVSNEINDTAAVFDEDALFLEDNCGNDGGGGGQGGGNTC